MKAVAVTPGVANSIAMRDVLDPQVGSQDVLVKVAQVGICGTDWEIKAGTYGAAPPESGHLVIGHEGLGIVAEVGGEAEGLAVGDYLVATVRRPCPQDRCLPCRSGQNDMCITGDYSERGIKSLHGYTAEYYGEHPQRLTKIPAELAAVGVLLEPLSVVEKAIRQIFKIQERLPWKPERAVVLGAGAIGLLGALLLRLRGIETHVLDRSEVGGAKSQLISRFGGRHLDTREMPVSQVAEEVGDVDIVLEATGFAPLVFEAAQNLAPNGVLCLLGVSAGAHGVDVESTQFNNRMVLGNRLIFGSVNANLVDFRSGVGHMQQISQQWPGALEAMLSRQTSIDDFQSAFERRPGDIKVAIRMDP